MLIGYLYGKKVTAKSITTLKRLASCVANGYCNSFDEMLVVYQHNGREYRLKYYRRNNKAPNNTITFGQWR